MAAIRGQQRRDEHDTQQDVGLAEVQLVGVELGHHQHGEPHQQRDGPAPLGQAVNRQGDKQREERNRQRVPGDLGDLGPDQRKRRHRQGEGGQILELVVPIVSPVERLGAESAFGGRAVDREVRHLRPHAGHVHGRGEHDNSQEPGCGADGERHALIYHSLMVAPGHWPAYVPILTEPPKTTPGGAARRYRERFGLWFDDLVVGLRFQHRPGLTLSQQDGRDECLDTLNQQMLHFDQQFASHTEWARCLMDSTLTTKVVIGMTWKTFATRTQLSGFDEITLTAPVFGGDTLYAESEVLARERPRRSIGDRTGADARSDSGRRDLRHAGLRPRRPEAAVR